MRRKLKIGVLKDEPRDMVVGCKKARLGKKLADKFFGRRGKVAIIVPGDFLDEVVITEVEGEKAGESQGTTDEIARRMGRSSGYVLSRKGTAVYIVGEAVFYDGVVKNDWEVPT